jgi:hypothetical protein
MKTYILKNSILALFILLLATSCKKDSVEPDDESPTAMPSASAEATAVIEGNDEAVTYRMSPTAPIDSGTCPSVKWSATTGIFPNTLTLDFGDGCVGPNGHRFYGQISVEVTGSIFAAGSVRTIDSDNFRIDGTRYTFHGVVTNRGNDAEGLMYWTVVFDLAAQKGNNGNTTTLHVDRVRTLMSGFDTFDTVTDDMYRITGKITGTRPNGRAYESIITTPLVKRPDCVWIVSGVETITFEGHDGVRTLDYGDGACDDKALLTMPDGESHEITLQHYFRSWH